MTWMKRRWGQKIDGDFDTLDSSFVNLTPWLRSTYVLIALFMSAKEVPVKIWRSTKVHNHCLFRSLIN